MSDRQALEEQTLLHVPTHLVGYDRKEGVTHQVLPPVENSDTAKQLLDELIRLFYQGMTSPIAYFPRTALACVDAGFSRGKWVDDEEKSLKKMADTFNDGFATSGEGNNTYIARIWPNWSEELGLQIRLLATLVLQAPRLQLVDSEEFKQ